MSNFADYQPEAVRQHLGTPIGIRPAQPRDLDACAQLIVSRTGGPPDERKQRLLADLDDRTRYSAVACSRDEVIGYGGVMRHERSPADPPTMAPTGFYLVGLIVTPDWRRHGVGELLTRDRMRWVAQRADHVYYFANLANRPILDLHHTFGFEEVTRDFTFPRAPLTPGTGVLLRASLAPTT
jgi:GNAT superfamily N-acetyltransferase